MNTNILQQIAEFVKLALDNSKDLQHQVYELRKHAAVEELDKAKYKDALKKAADALYDTDFLTDEQEKRTFLKKAAEDPIYVVRFLEKVCEAADVAQIGRPARVAARHKEAEYDPVMARAFGYAHRDIVDD